MRARLVAVDYDDYKEHSNPLPLPLANEAIRQGDIVFIAYVPDAQGYRVFKFYSDDVGMEYMGMSLTDSGVGEPVIVTAKATISSTKSKIEKVWVVEKS